MNTWKEGEVQCECSSKVSVVFVRESREFRWCVKSPKQFISSGLGLGDYSFRVSGQASLT